MAYQWDSLPLEKVRIFTSLEFFKFPWQNFLKDINRKITQIFKPNYLAEYNWQAFLTWRYIWKLNVFTTLRIWNLTSTASLLINESCEFLRLKACKRSLQKNAIKFPTKIFQLVPHRNSGVLIINFSVEVKNKFCVNLFQA